MRRRSGYTLRPHTRSNADKRWSAGRGVGRKSWKGKPERNYWSKERGGVVYDSGYTLLGKGRPIQAFKKVVRVGTVDTGRGRRGSIHCEIEYTQDGRLSISGVIGALPSGNALGGCGQINMEFAHRNPKDNDSRYDHLTRPSEITFAKGWNAKKWLDFLDVWKHYHLNDMKAGCVHQEAEGWGDKKLIVNGEEKLSTWVYPKDHPEGVLGKPCPICGYKYGTAWNKAEVPRNVLVFLRNLPDADKQPAWV